MGRLLASLALAGALAACAVPHAPGGPTNVGDAKIAARDFRQSGAYDREFAAVAAEASAWLREAAPGASHPALVLDVDETALSNWEVIQANDFGRFASGPCALPEGPCGWAAWDQLGRSTPLSPTAELVEVARELGVAVYFITGRPESQRAATERNLREAGYQGFAGLDMVPDGQHFAHAADFKAPRRAVIEATGLTVIANMGDQPSDLAGGHALRTFLLPNPFYRIP
ncbi:MAG: HAD family acid phosphatase [Geminicoccaceae bacterium]|jgi:HAD superfamily, subfamily IIIB (Acid phosphatase)